MTGIDNIDDDDDVSATKKRPILNLTTPIRIGGVRRNRCKYRRIVGTGMVTFGLANAPTEINGLKILKKKKTPPPISINQTYKTYLDAAKKNEPKPKSKPKRGDFRQQSQEDFVLEKTPACERLSLEDFKYSKKVVLYQHEQSKEVVKEPCFGSGGTVYSISCSLLAESSSGKLKFRIASLIQGGGNRASCDCKAATFPGISTKFCTREQFENEFKKKAAELEVTYNTDSDVPAEKHHLHLVYDATRFGYYNKFFLRLVREPGCLGAGISSFREKSHEWFCQDVLVDNEEKKVRNFCSLRYIAGTGLFSVVRERTVDAESEECP